ncbi:hypothetical protein H5T51_04455 [Candidatus Bathyarchaeota archaeon]|nr:hypothetical protein [Candidatus Bathyarchaeota archaeon]
MDSFESLLRRIVESFNAAGLDYMFTGALAVSYYGRARTTADIDIVVAVGDVGWRDRLISALRTAGLIVEEKALDDALESGYNIATFRDGKSPLTVDLILSPRKLSKKSGKILGLPTYFQKPEDLVLAKLRMIKATVPQERAQKDVDDIKAILKFAKVDLEAVKRKAKKESTLQILEGLVAESLR